MMMNSDYLIDMGRTFRRDDDHKFGSKNKKPKPKKNKFSKVKQNFSDDRYDIAETYEDQYSGGFEKFTYGKRKGK